MINTGIGNFEIWRGNLEGKPERPDSHDRNPGNERSLTL